MKNNKKEDIDIELVKLKSINDDISKCVNRYFRMKLKKNLRTFTGINVDRLKIFHIYKQKNVKI
tara:strand:- start:768 stop:959 length:192 start_codon:yes stop_codon:yes gene_type:complete